MGPPPEVVVVVPGDAVLLDSALDRELCGRASADKVSVPALLMVSVVELAAALMLAVDVFFIDVNRGVK